MTRKNCTFALPVYQNEANVLKTWNKHPNLDPQLKMISTTINAVRPCKCYILVNHVHS